MYVCMYVCMHVCMYVWRVVTLSYFVFLSSFYFPVIINILEELTFLRKRHNKKTILKKKSLHYFIKKNRGNSDDNLK